ncbi:MAG: ribulose-phosphate 3-epimerase [Actinomycetia bacterium]|nr:ribulose-phosphate 3-epimerase [Actinomycetes bacterium]
MTRADTLDGTPAGGHTRLSAGVLTADLTRLAAQLEVLHGTDCWAHIDVMDGQFCPTLTFGAPIIKAVAACGVPADAHLMVQEPRQILPEVVAAGPRVVTVHAEATKHLHRTLQELTALRAEQPEDRQLIRGVGLNPGSPVELLEPVLELTDFVLVLAVNPGWGGQRPAANTRRRVDAVRELAAALGQQVLVGVDGGVTLANAAQMAGWGLDVIVSGSAIYDGKDPAGNLAKMLAQLAAASGDPNHGGA